MVSFSNLSCRFTGTNTIALGLLDYFMYSFSVPFLAVCHSRKSANIDRDERDSLKMLLYSEDFKGVIRTWNWKLLGTCIASG